MQDSGRGQVLIIKHVLCVMPGNEHNKKPCINSNTSRALEFPDLYTAVFLINTCSLIACGTGIYAIIIVKVFAP